MSDPFAIIPWWHQASVKAFRPAMTQANHLFVQQFVQANSRGNNANSAQNYAHIYRKLCRQHLSIMTSLNEWQFIHKFRVHGSGIVPEHNPICNFWCVLLGRVKWNTRWNWNQYVQKLNRSWNRYSRVCGSYSAKQYGLQWILEQDRMFYLKKMANYFGTIMLCLCFCMFILLLHVGRIFFADLKECILWNWKQCICKSWGTKTLSTYMTLYNKH